MDRLVDMKVVCLTFAFLLSISTLNGALVLRAEESVELPKWSMGDTWTYAADYRTALGMRARGTETHEVSDDYFLIGSHECYEVSYEGVGTVYEGNVNGTWTEGGKTYYDRSDRSRVKDALTHNLTVTSAGEIHVISQVVEKIYGPPLQVNKGFPLLAGKSWSASTTEMTTVELTSDGEKSQQNNSVTYTMNFIVLRTELTNVSAGLFETFVIKATKSDGSHEEYYYADKARTDIKQVNYDSEGNEVGRIELLQYRRDSCEDINAVVVVGAVIVFVALFVGILVFLIRKGRNPRTLRAVPPGSGKSEKTMSMSPRIVRL